MPCVVNVCGRRGAMGAAGVGLLARGSVTQSSLGLGVPSYIRSLSRHCERSEAIHFAQQAERMDCFVASLLAMTVENAANYSAALRRRRPRTPGSGSPRAPP